MRASEIHKLELLWQGFIFFRRQVMKELQDLAEEIQKILPDQPLHQDRDYHAELDDIYQEKTRGKS